MYNQVFRDTTTGNNFFPGSPAKYSAVAGYDLCKLMIGSLGTLAVIVLLGIIGYIAGAGVRADIVDVPLEPEAASAPA